MLMMLTRMIMMMLLLLMIMMTMIMMYGHPTHPQWFEHQSVDANLLTPSLPLRLLPLQSGIGVSCFGDNGNHLFSMAIHPM